MGAVVALGFPLARGSGRYRSPTGPGARLRYLHDFDQDPLEPAVAGVADAAVAGAATGTPRSGTLLDAQLT